MSERQAGPVVVLGERGQGGVYLLRIRVERALTLAFGRYQDGRAVPLPPGDYVYVGSARAEKGSVTLARRALRHATRTGSRPPHPIRDAILAACRAHGLGPEDLRPPGGKRAFWNVDHLLDHEAVALTGVLLVRGPDPAEERLAHWLENDPCTTAFAPGLGAGDHPGSTHLLRVQGGARWWGGLPGRVDSLRRAPEEAPGAHVGSATT